MALTPVTVLSTYEYREGKQSKSPIQEPCRVGTSSVLPGLGAVGISQNSHPAQELGVQLEVSTGLGGSPPWADIIDTPVTVETAAADADRLSRFAHSWLCVHPRPAAAQGSLGVVLSPLHACTQPCGHSGPPVALESTLPSIPSVIKQHVLGSQHLLHSLQKPPGQPWESGAPAPPNTSS